MKVAMITDYGDITDQSFNQTTYEASKAWCEANNIEFTYKKPASDADQDRESATEDAIEQGYNVIVMPGFAFGDVIVNESEMYPDVKFIALDVSDVTLPDNAYSAIYQEELAGYMAGYAAVKLGYKKLGYLGGMAVPSVVRYGSGFVQGADAAAVEMELTDVEINYVYGGAFAGNAGITARMDTWFSGGTEIVFAAGGSIYTSACEAAAKVNGKIIGVDVDQSGIIDGDYGAGMTVTSAMKGLAATVNTMLDEIKAGNWDKYGGKVDNLGIVSDNPEENYVQIPLDTTQFSDEFTADDYKALVKKLNAGEIKVDATSDTDFIPETTNVKVNNEGSMG
jgi:basic membrane protein A